MRSEYAVELGADAFDGAAALVVHEMGAELDCDAAERVEGVPEQEQLGLGVEPGTLDVSRVPGRADLDATVGSVDIHVGGHAGGLAGVRINNGEGQHRSGSVEAKAAFDLRVHFLGRGGRGVPELPEFAVLNCGDEAVVMVEREWHERDVLAFEGGWLKDVGVHKSQYMARV